MEPVDLEACPSGVTCLLMGWTRETLRKRTNAGIAIKVAHGKYNCIATAANERTHQGDRRRGVVSIETSRLRRAQSERIEQQTAIQRHELIHMDDLTAVASALAAMFARSMGALDKRLPPAIAGKDGHELRAAIKSETDAIRQGVSDSLNAMAALAETGNGSRSSKPARNARPGYKRTS